MPSRKELYLDLFRNYLLDNVRAKRYLILEFKSPAAAGCLLLNMGALLPGKHNIGAAIGHCFDGLS